VKTERVKGARQVGVGERACGNLIVIRWASAGVDDGGSGGGCICEHVCEKGGLESAFECALACACLARAHVYVSVPMCVGTLVGVCEIERAFEWMLVFGLFVFASVCV
jgi:hypothetical protein